MSVFKWEIRNIGLCSLLPGECIQSPTFYVEESKMLEFCLNLYPKGINLNSKSVDLQLTRCDRNVCKIRLRYYLQIRGMISNSNIYDNTFRNSLEQLDIGQFLSIPRNKCSNILKVICRVLKRTGVRKTNRMYKYLDLEDLSRSYKSLLNESTFSDVSLRIGMTVFNVHKAVLVTRFPTLTKVLMDDKLEGLIDLPDFQILIDFLYTGKISCHMDEFYNFFLKKYRLFAYCLPYLYPIEVSAISACKLEIKHHSFEWSIDNFIDVMLSGEVLSYKLPEASETKLLELNIFLKQNTSDTLIFMIHRSDNSTNVAIMCKIYVSLKNDESKDVFQYENRFLTEANWEIPMNSEMKSLQQIKEKYLQNDTLKIHVEIKIIYGKHSSVISDIRFERIPFSEIEQLQYLGYDFKRLFENPVHTDVILKVSGTVFPAHKAILSARSPVFKSMFECDMAEKQRGEVIIEDIRTEAVHSLLLYMYCSHVHHLEFDIAFDLYYAASKYQIPRLQQKCCMILKKCLNVQNVGEILVLANTHGDEKLKKFAFEFVSMTYISGEMNMIESSEWKEIMDSHPDISSEVSEVLQSDIVQTSIMMRNIFSSEAYQECELLQSKMVEASIMMRNVFDVQCE